MCLVDNFSIQRQSMDDMGPQARLEAIHASETLEYNHTLWHTQVHLVVYLLIKMV